MYTTLRVVDLYMCTTLRVVHLYVHVQLWTCTSCQVTCTCICLQPQSCGHVHGPQHTCTCNSPVESCGPVHVYVPESCGPVHVYVYMRGGPVHVYVTQVTCI